MVELAYHLSNGAEAGGIGGITCTPLSEHFHGSYLIHRSPCLRWEELQDSERRMPTLRSHSVAGHSEVHAPPPAPSRHGSHPQLAQPAPCLAEERQAAALCHLSSLCLLGREPTGVGILSFPSLALCYDFSMETGSGRGGD